MQVPPYALVLITLSKRLHSIYVLRMFNDGVGMVFFYAAVLAWTSKKPKWTLGSILFRYAACSISAFPEESHRLGVT